MLAFQNGSPQHPNTPPLLVSQPLRQSSSLEVVNHKKKNQKNIFLYMTTYYYFTQ